MERRKAPSEYSSRLKESTSSNIEVIDTQDRDAFQEQESTSGELLPTNPNALNPFGQLSLGQSSELAVTTARSLALPTEMENTITGGKFPDATFGPVTHHHSSKHEASMTQIGKQTNVVNKYFYTSGGRSSEALDEPSTSADQTKHERKESDVLVLGGSIKIFKNQRLHERKKIFKGEKATAGKPIPVVVKLVDYSKEALREAESLHSVDFHPNVVRIYESGTFASDVKYIYISMELCSPKNLYDYVKKTEQIFDPCQAIRHSTQIISGLEYIHRKGIAHRDLKPHNILFSVAGGYDQIKISDFGLSKNYLRDPRATTTTGEASGTIGYMAPELVKCEKPDDPTKCDIFSLGIVLVFRMSNGQHPYGEEYYDWTPNIARGTKPNLDIVILSNGKQTDGIKLVISKMLRHTPDTRPGAQDLLNEWIAIVGDESVDPFSVPAIPSVQENEEEAETVDGGGVEQEVFEIRPITAHLETQIKEIRDESADPYSVPAILSVQEEVERVKAGGVEQEAFEIRPISAHLKEIRDESADPFSVPDILSVQENEEEAETVEEVGVEGAFEIRPIPAHLETQIKEIRGESPETSMAISTEEIRLPPNAQHTAFYEVKQPSMSSETISAHTSKESDVTNNSTQKEKTSKRLLRKEDPLKRKEYETQKLRFLNMIDKFDRRRFYILCSCISPIEEGNDYEPLSFIPWPKVFDLDFKSEDTGLLNAVSDKLQKGRFVISYTTEQPKQLNEGVINWTIIEPPENIGRGDYDYLKQHISSASRYCAGNKPPIIIILYYHNDSTTELEENLFELVISMNQDFNNRAIFVLCLPEVPDDGSMLSKLSKKRYVSDNRIIAPVQKVCNWISEFMPSLAIQNRVEHKLPKFKEDDGDDGTFILQDGDFNWISTDLKILPLGKMLENFDEINRMGVEYLKGGDLAWEVLSTCKYDVPRDISKNIVKFIETNHIDKGGCGIVTLYHSPGSGGSTIGRRVIWELRDTVPCLILQKKATVNSELKEKVKVIRDKSNLPVVLLIDGRSAQEVRNILDMCKYERMIILHVTRFYFQIRKQHHRNGKFYLTDSLSVSEAVAFERVYAKHGNAATKSRLAQLTKEVNEGKQHSVFEYGLTAFHTEFRGIGKYVESHLRLGQRTEVWQKVAAILSLSNYYGNIALPAEFFYPILDKYGSDVVDLETDIPEWGQQLIRECHDSCDWKISHYLVAKEILDQYLGGGSDSKSDTLLLSSRKNLHRLANDLLECAKQHIGSRENIHDDFTAIFNIIFIVRDNKEEVDPSTPQKALTFSRLITHVPEVGQRRELFEKLVKYFPTNAEFCAHLGRFYSKAGLHAEAIEALKRAVHLRKRALELENLDAAKSGDEVLYRIHSMFGYAYNARIRQMFGNKAVGFLSDDAYSKMSRKDTDDVYQGAVGAVEQFRKCREYYCPSVKSSYGFIGEIQARLHVTEFCKKRSNYNLLAVANPQNDMHFLWKFIQESFTECDALLDQCIVAEGESQYIQSELTKYLNLFSDYFAENIELAKWVGDGKTLSSKRRRVAFLKIKLKSGEKREFRVFQDLKYPQQVTDMFNALELVLDDKASANIRISPYMEECLKIVRHSTLHTKWPVRILQVRIGKWCDRGENRSLAAFYKYVITFIYALLYPSSDENVIVDRCKRDLEESRRFFSRDEIKRPIEWLKVIPPYDQLTMLLLNHWREPEKIPSRHIVRGRVVEVTPEYGRIRLEERKLTIHFVPRKFDVNRYHADERRKVEFIIGFNIGSGAQAYNVSWLQSKTCLQCGETSDTSELRGELACHRCGHFNGPRSIR